MLAPFDEHRPIMLFDHIYDKAIHKLSGNCSRPELDRLARYSGNLLLKKIIVMLLQASGDYSPWPDVAVVLERVLAL